ncbi:hypothetical protein D0T84_09075 [Dysgonomonas sp. 521]|uniref:hypothetical protein n=1 Tax=Dysgonomonas sp. 521 TaxID=2302932 RepID=UPI0013D3F580|nr:hypothetical protein [Dysgonomonas sp. 521]NDV95069.1 hypothetical protein [Dysgonomonas sp. 521]
MMNWYTKKKRRIQVDKIISHDDLAWDKDIINKSAGIKVEVSETEQRITINATSSRLASIVCGGIFFLAGIIFAYFTYTEAINSLDGKILSIICILFGGVLFIYSLVRPKRLFTFDRLNGTITYPETQANSINSIYFKDSEWVKKYSFAGRFYIGDCLALVQSNEYSTVTLLYNDFYSEWSYLVWFMDKNRPLPPGTIFDSIRKADYNRRKTDGFPPPLYNATILISEDKY